MIVTLKPAYLDRNQTAAFVSLSDTTLEQMVRAGTFPQPRQLSAKRVGWRVSELEEWCDNRPVSTLLPPVNAGIRRTSATAQPPADPSARPAA